MSVRNSVRGRLGRQIRVGWTVTKIDQILYPVGSRRLRSDRLPDDLRVPLLLLIINFSSLPSQDLDRFVASTRSSIHLDSRWSRCRRRLLEKF